MKPEITYSDSRVTYNDVDVTYNGFWRRIRDIISAALVPFKRF